MESCDLCIVGAGYAGINALNAAAAYLPSRRKRTCLATRPSRGQRRAARGGETEAGRASAKRKSGRASKKPEAATAQGCASDSTT